MISSSHLVLIFAVVILQAAAVKVKQYFYKSKNMFILPDLLKYPHDAPQILLRGD